MQTERKVARPERLELPTLWFEARCSIQLSYGRAGLEYNSTLGLSGQLTQSDKDSLRLVRRRYFQV